MDDQHIIDYIPGYHRLPGYNRLPGKELLIPYPWMQERTAHC